MKNPYNWPTLKFGFIRGILKSEDIGKNKFVKYKFLFNILLFCLWIIFSCYNFYDYIHTKILVFRIKRILKKDIVPIFDKINELKWKAHKDRLKDFKYVKVDKE